MEIRNELNINGNGTRLFCDDNWNYHAPHHFTVKRDDEELCHIHFQEGPVKEVGINGVRDEDLLMTVLTRLEAFQSSEFKCNENQEAINGIREALESLQNRTLKRYNRGVEGTSQI